MPDTSGPYDGAPWAEADWYRSMASTLPSGVHGTTPATSASAGSLGWATSGLTVSPAAGRANVGGSGYVRTASLTSVAATANTHASFSRRDRLVLRRSLSTHNVTLAIITGTPASAPVAPAISRDDTTWDLPLFSFLVPPASGTTISGVQDERTWINPLAPDATAQVSDATVRTALTSVLPVGATVVQADTTMTWQWNGTSWVPIGSLPWTALPYPAPWYTDLSTFQSYPPLSYRVLGGEVFLRGWLKCISAVGQTGGITTNNAFPTWVLPPTQTTVPLHKNLAGAGGDLVPLRGELLVTTNTLTLGDSTAIQVGDYVSLFGASFSYV